MINSKLERRKANWSLLSIALLFLVLDRQWGFVFTNTVYASQAMVYISFLLLLFLFITVAAKYAAKWTLICIIWTPYILSTILGYVINLKLQHVTYWFICFVLILTASRAPLLKSIPSKLLYYSGLFALLGIAVQLFFPSYYSSHILNLFVLEDDRMEKWIEGIGLNGFTYQLGQTASILVYCEIVLLYLPEKVSGIINRKKILYYLLLGLIVLGIFSTGKRLHAVLALALPFIVYLVSSMQHNMKKFLIVLFCILIAGLSYEYFVNNVYMLSDSFLIGRFANSYIEMQYGGDIYSGRQELYDMALKVFRENPLLGIGVGRFREYTGSLTQVHNTYLQVLCEQGIIGFVMFIIPILYCFSYTLTLLKKVKDKTTSDYLYFSLGLQLVYLLCGLTGNENIGSGFVFYFIAVGILVSCDKIQKFSLKK